MANPSRFTWFFRPHLPDEDMPLSAELRFAEALAELPAIERSALALSEIGGLGTEEIAQRLGTDAVVVRKLLARARETVRTTIAVRGRRGLTALFPFQSWWNSGSTAPVLRTAGAVAAAVIGTGVAIGGAAADSPRPVLVSPDPPVVRSLDRPQGRLIPVAAVPDTALSDTALSDSDLRQQPRKHREEDGTGPAAARPEGDRHGDMGATPGETAGRPPYAPARRGDEPVLGARPTPPPAPEPGSRKPPLQEPAPPVPPSPPLPFPTPYPVPIPVPAPVPAPVPIPVPVPAPAPVPLGELPVDPPALPPLPPLP